MLVSALLVLCISASPSQTVSSNTIYEASGTFTEVVPHPDGTRLYAVRVFMDDVLVIREGDLSPITTIPVGNGPNNITITPDGKYGLVPINEENNSRLDVILLTPSHVDYHKVVQQVTIAGQRGVQEVIVSPDGTTAYLITQRPGAGAIYPISLIDFTIGDPIPNPWSSGQSAIPSSMAFSPDGSKFYVSMSQQFNGNDILVYSHTHGLMTPLRTININQNDNVGGAGALFTISNGVSDQIWVTYGGRKLRRGFMGTGGGFLVLDINTDQLVADFPNTEFKRGAAAPFCGTPNKEHVLVLLGDYYIHTYNTLNLSNVSTYNGTDYFRQRKQANSSDSYFNDTYYACNIGPHGNHAYISTSSGSIHKMPISNFFTGTAKPAMSQTTVYDNPSIQAYYIYETQSGTLCCDIRVIGNGFQNIDNPGDLWSMEHITGYDLSLESSPKNAKSSTGTIREDGFFTSVFPMDYFSFQPGTVATNIYRMKIGNTTVHFELEISEPFPGASTVYPHYPDIPLYGYEEWLNTYGWPEYLPVVVSGSSTTHNPAPTPIPYIVPTPTPYVAPKTEVTITQSITNSTGYTVTSDSTLPPSIITGRVTNNGVAVAYGTRVAALINGQFNTSVTTGYGGDYTLNITADHNDEITFNIDGEPSLESVTLYDFGTVFNLDLTVGNNVQSAIVAPLGSNLTRIFNFNNETKTWAFYDPDPTFSSINSLNVISSGSVYWIKIKYDTTVILNRTVRKLYEGWNLVSY